MYVIQNKVSTRSFSIIYRRIFQNKQSSLRIADSCRAIKYEKYSNGRIYTLDPLFDDGHCLYEILLLSTFITRYPSSDVRMFSQFSLRHAFFIRRAQFHRRLIFNR